MVDAPQRAETASRRSTGTTHSSGSMPNSRAGAFRVGPSSDSSTLLYRATGTPARPRPNLRSRSTTRGTNPPRLGRLAWNCIFGCDAESRAARTAKMNMIMHGDGHGGIHYRDGLVDINGIFPGRFDIVITNPPFGSNVGNDQKVNGSEETRVSNDPAYMSRCEARYGERWRQSHEAMEKAQGTNILDLFEIGKGKKNRATEIVFVERCLKLLKPGGRMGIVLPDGNLNNPSLTWLRRWCEGKARLLAVVSLPEETFSSAKATVKASLVFLRRFTEEDEADWEAAWEKAHDNHDDDFDAEREAICAGLGRRYVTGESKAMKEFSKSCATSASSERSPTGRRGRSPTIRTASANKGH